MDSRNPGPASPAPRRWAKRVKRSPPTAGAAPYPRTTVQCLQQMPLAFDLAPRDNLLSLSAHVCLGRTCDVFLDGTKRWAATAGS